MSEQQIPNNFTMDVATKENSTTFEKLEAGRRRARMAITVLVGLATTLLTLAVSMPVAPVVAAVMVGVACVDFMAAVVVGWTTNTMTPEEAEKLLAQVLGATQRLRAPESPPTQPGSTQPRTGPPAE